MKNYYSYYRLLKKDEFFQRLCRVTKISELKLAKSIFDLAKCLSESERELLLEKLLEHQSV
ncbi:MAG: hypothetical protein DRO04_00935 [Candidatus Iainarchaeum archaeon]|uniref:Uncharacterized protein n=1 Tax=Candidatus Iainarchaeum sp. TaxID=3101447 RepID=A0A497JHR6_9ARCH|nr:MAG: hypothetical protein DRO04_00935 [Candidatus Diapherotrites archaeon]